MENLACLIVPDGCFYAKSHVDLALSALEAIESEEIKTLKKTLTDYYGYDEQKYIERIKELEKGIRFYKYDYSEFD